MNNSSKRLILGLNYSGVHDSAIAQVTASGEIVSACALERISRVKQDGRPPDPLFRSVDWNSVETIAVSTDEEIWSPVDPTSKLHPTPLSEPRNNFLKHGPPFHEYLAGLPRPKRFVCHQLSHAASAFWLSGFHEALCFTYDGGIFNNPWFGGLYKAHRTTGIEPLDRFAASHYAKITSLYTIVTALLGFTPNKHEGKVTGLAAYGSVNAKCRDLLEELFHVDFLKGEALMEWFHAYSTETPPIFWVHRPRQRELFARFADFRREDIAYALQAMAEDHVVEILRRAREFGWHSPAICLAGGLFANVKINQRIKQCGFEQIFIAPPMTDDGTALGAALVVASEQPGFSPKPAHHMFFGPAYSREDIELSLKKHGLRYKKVSHPAERVAHALKEGAVVGVYQGQMEYGPRALGNRSILSAATNPDINRVLNERLRRTEFMPFAPITRIEDASSCYTDLQGAEHAAEFMTITCGCAKEMSERSPAVVHVDGTARPQLVRAEIHPFIHAILTEYKRQTGIASLINTSFNVHEEPIVCAPDDAIQGFLEAGLDYLYMEGGYLVSFADNQEAALRCLQREMAVPSQKERELASAALALNEKVEAFAAELAARAQVIDSLNRAVQGPRNHQEKLQDLESVAAERLSEMIQKEKVIGDLVKALEQQRHRAEELETVAAERLAAMIEKEEMIRQLTAELAARDAVPRSLKGDAAKLQARK